MALFIVDAPFVNLVCFVVFVVIVVVVANLLKTVLFCSLIVDVFHANYLSHTASKINIPSNIKH